MLVIGGMLSLGKSSVAKILGEEFGTKVFYESVEDNPFLPLFYTLTEEELSARRIPFLLQLYFLKTRYRDIRQALLDDNNVLDRSLYEDGYFCKKNMEMGRISEEEYGLYLGLMEEMMIEIESLPKKSPDLMIYLKGSFETVLHRISLRGREYELDDSLKSYYFDLWKDYDDWVYNHYNASEVLVVDMDTTDVVNNIADRDRVVQAVRDKLKEIRG